MKQFLFKLVRAFLNRVWYKYIVYNIKGAGNKIILVSENGAEKALKKHQRISHLNIHVIGNGNTIRISDKANFMGKCEIRLNVCNNANIDIQESPRICDLRIRSKNADNIGVVWGAGSVVWSIDFILNENNAKIIIGRNCALSSLSSIWATDAHPIFDLETKKLLNRIKRPLVIGNNCWIGSGSRLMKNTDLPDNTMVGSGSVVTKRFTEPNTIIAGNPAKVVKTGIGFNFRIPMHEYKEPQQ